MQSDTKLLERAVDIIAAYVTKNQLPAVDLPGLIKSVHTSLAQQTTPIEPVAEVQVPHVPVKKSITSDFLICLEDGRPFKSLKRHLRSKYGMTPEAYRAKWGLPKDYPMVAPAYSASRSILAKKLKLGVKGKSPRKAKAK